MKEQKWALIEATVEKRNDLVGRVLWGFRLLMQQVTTQQTQALQEVRVWVEQEGNSQHKVNRIWRSIQSQEQGPLLTEPKKQMLFEPFYVEGQVHPRVRELLYLYTRDVHVDNKFQPLLQENLQELRKKGFRQFAVASPLLASATVHLYHVIMGDEELGDAEASVFMGRASTWDELRQIILELPSDAVSFDIHFEVRGRIVGNATYRVEHELDPVTGKRLHLGVMDEFGACEGLHEIFADLYNTEDEYHQYVYWEH